MKKETEDRNNKIIAQYNEQDQLGTKHSDIVTKLSADNDITKFSVQTILRKAGVVMGRKEKTKASRLTDRNRKIMDLTEDGQAPEVIGETFDITPTRVRQIIRNNITDFKRVKLEQQLSDIKDDVYKNVQYKDIIEKYGQKTIKDIKANLGYNLFRTCRARRDGEIIKLVKSGMTAAEIAEKYDLCKDYIYTICHDNNIRRATRADLTPKERDKRNRKIYNLCIKHDMNFSKVGSLSGLSGVMIKIIYNQQKSKHDESDS